MNLIQQLTALFEQKSLHSSIIVQTNDLKNACSDVRTFCKNFLNVDLSNYDENGLLIQPEETGRINVACASQIQQLFAKKTSKEHKVVIVMEASAMSKSCANSCLKFLEEPSPATFIFLITTQSYNLLATITSRCYKINHNYLLSLAQDELTAKLSASFAQKQLSSFLATLDLKVQWPTFTDGVLRLLSKLVKQVITKPATLNSGQLECVIKIPQLLTKTVRYDLDKKSNALIILNLLYENFSHQH
jgi:hypothetical protein